MASVAVASRSFSSHPVLRAALRARYQAVAFNDSGKTLSGEALIAFLQNHDMAILGLEKMDASVLHELKQLKTISRFGVGLDMLDLPTIKKLGIKLAATPGANKRAVAELVIGLAINMLRNIPLSHQELIQGSWKQRKGRQLSGKKVGIIGMGAIGQDLALLLKAFACEIYVFDVTDHQEFYQAHGLNPLSVDELLQTADIVTVHVPLTADTRHMIDARRLRLMKHDAILINAARGGLVDEQALKAHLTTNPQAAAAFDVFETEPDADLTLLALPNFLGTPHIGGSTEEAILAMGFAAIEGLEQAV
jgi:phosphoglycerate dehydrogenase-like enzyme